MNVRSRNEKWFWILISCLPLIAVVLLNASVADNQSGSVLFGSAPLKIQYFNVETSTSGDNTILEAVADKELVLLSVTFVAAKESDAVVGAYVHAGDVNLIGSPTARIPLDKSSIVGFSGYTHDAVKGCVVRAGADNTAIKVNLDANQKLIIYGTYAEK